MNYKVKEKLRTVSPISFYLIGGKERSNSPCYEIFNLREISIFPDSTEKLPGNFVAVQLLHLPLVVHIPSLTNEQQKHDKRVT